MKWADTEKQNNRFVPITQTSVSEDIIILKWKLIPDELEFISLIATKKNLVWSAFCYLFSKNMNRFPGFSDSIPFCIRGFINRQFLFPFDAEIVIPERDATRADLRSKILTRLGYEVLDDNVIFDLQAWATQEALKGTSWAKIRDAVPKTLSDWRTLLPPEESLRRIISKTIEAAEESYYKKIAGSLSADQREVLEQLMVPRQGTTTSTFSAMRVLPNKVNPESILEILDKFFLVEDQRFDKVDLKFISPKALSKTADFSISFDVYELKRFKADKRHALLLCALIDSGSKMLDRVVQMHEIFMLQLDRKARNASEREFFRAKRKSKKALKLILKTSKIVLKYKDQALLRSLSQQIDCSELRAAVENTEMLQKIDERGYADKLLSRHSRLKRYLPKLLTLQFSAEKSAESLLAAIEAYLFHLGGQSEEHPCLEFETLLRSPFCEIRSQLTPSEQRKAWEISLAFEIKEKLRTLSLYLPQSQNHKSFWTMVEGEGSWRLRKNDAYKKLAIPKSFSTFSRKIEEDFSRSFERFSKGFKKNPFVYLDKTGKLSFHKTQKMIVPEELPELLNSLRSLIPSHVPIEDVLFEVEALTGFTSQLTPSFVQRRKPEEEIKCILATLLAHGTNIGLAGMANATQDVTVDALLETTRSRLTKATLDAANEAIISYHKQLSFSKHFETAPISSSDGQRFRVQESTLHADLCTRYFGNFRKAINFVTHITPCGAVFATQPLLCGMRESIAMVNGLGQSDPRFHAPMHTTDTHGYTDAMFLILELFGIQFAPRLKDLGDARLFMPESFSDDGALANIFEKKKISLEEYAPAWDEIVRVVSALKSGQVSAQSILPKVISCQSGDTLAQAFKKIGQILKTTFLLRYFHESELRQQIRHQLNIGETRHSLARQVFFSNKGEFRPGDLDALISKASCLSLICNAILLWNTVEMEKAFQKLTLTGQSFDTKLLKHISPLTWENIRISGRYDFKYNLRHERG